MMRLFGSLLASSKASKLVLERSVAAYQVITKHSYEPRFFSDQPSAIPQVSKLSPTDAGVKDVKETSTNGLIRVMSTQHVKPHNPTPQNLRSYKLSAFDQVNPPHYVPFVFFYANNANGNNDIPERSKRLKESLSKTLTQFYPFAGKYIDDNHIECNDEGVYYIETRIDGDLSSFIAKPDYKLLQKLLPMPPDSKEPTRGFYISMIQVNFFSCGGVGISIAHSHKLVDGCTYMTFLKAWASLAKGDDDDDDQKKMTFHPNFEASTLFPPNTILPTYPSFPLSLLCITPFMLRGGKSSTKRFRFDASAIQALRSQVSSTRVVAVTSFIWKCATAAARKLQGERTSILQIAVNLRPKCAPPLPSSAIGNISWSGVARCEPNDKLSLDSMVGHVKDGIAKVDTSYVEQFKGEQGCNNLIKEMKRVTGEMSKCDANYYMTTSVCNFGAYDTDFGWGRPVWACSGIFSNDVPIYTNFLILMDTSKGDGIEALVTLSQEEMDLLEGDPDLLLYASIEPSPLLG